MKKLNIGIIGSNSFIGSKLCDKLIKTNNFNSLHLFSKSDNKLCLKLSKNITFNKIDIKDNLTYKSKFKDIDIIYYLVSESIPSSTWNNPSYEFTNNVIPFIEVMEEISSSNVKKIIFSSSAGTIYGSSNKKIIENTDKKPFNPYGISKLTMEHLLEFYKVKNNIHYFIFRISNIYGYGQNTSNGLGLINTILEKSINKKPVTIFGDGSIIRNYIYIDDVIEILTKSLNKPLNESNILNLSSDDNLSINQIINIITKTTNLELQIEYANLRKSDNPKILLNNNKISSFFDDFRFTDINTGIDKTLKKLLL